MFKVYLLNFTTKDTDKKYSIGFYSNTKRSLRTGSFRLFMLMIIHVLVQPSDQTNSKLICLFPEPAYNLGICLLIKKL